MVTINIYIKPGAKKQGVSVQSDFERDKVYFVSVRALPKEGAANKELIEVLAEYFKVSKSYVEIKKGFKSRYKVVVLHKD